MRKIPTIFVREYNGKIAIRPISQQWTEGMERVRSGEAVATYKWDGTAIKIMGGAVFKRYDAKGGKAYPPGFLSCGVPDHVTGHHPGWIPADVLNDPADKWLKEALPRWAGVSAVGMPQPGTYELVGPKVGGNPHGFVTHRLIKHGVDVLENFPRTWVGMLAYFETHPPMEGVVFWLDGEPFAKIKGRDFGLEWANAR